MNHRVQLGFILWLALILSAAAQTNQYGGIHENDSAPIDLGNGQVAWNYEIQNADFGKITSVRFENVFSTTAPVALSLPTSWTFASSPGSPTNSWTVEVTAANSLVYIPVGASKSVTFRTTFTHTNHSLLTGPRPGAVMFELYPGDWYSPGVSGLIGPVGENPTGTPTLALQPTLFDARDYDAARPGTQWALRYAFTNTSPDGLATGGAPFDLVSLTLPSGTNAGVYLVQPALGCAAWSATLDAGSLTLDGHAQPLPVGASGQVTLYFDAGVLATNPVTAQAAGYVPGGELAFAPVPVPVPAAATANPYGRIWETDGVPEDLGGGQLVWAYAVQNTSSGNITSVRFENVFSTTTPILDVGRTGWNLTATDSNSDQLWEITISAGTLNYLPAGQTDFFSFVTTYTSITNRLLTGPRPGAVKFDTSGIWYSPDVTGLIGPVGEVPTNPPPVVPGLSVLRLGAPGVSLTATNLAWGYGYTLERSPDLLAWTNLFAFPATNATQVLNFPLPANAPRQFYRLRSP